MIVRINDVEVEAKLSERSNTGAEDSVLSLRIDGWFVLEISDKGKLRLCQNPRIVETDENSTIVIEEGEF